MENVAFDISERNEKGKKVRNEGAIPCVIYGGELKKSIPAKITRRDVDKLLCYPKSSIFSLNLDGKKENCVVKELQKNNFGKVIHIDFQYVKNDEIIKLKIPINYEGQDMLECKRLLVETFLSEIELHGEVDKFPKNIDINLENLEYGDKVLAKDLKLPEGIKLGIDGDTVLAKIEGNVSEEVEEE